MDYLFQTDINGALEYLEREPGDAIDVFQTSLQPTLDYYQGSPEARMALAQVLFRAWHFRDVHRTDFSVSRYGRGIHTAEYLALVDSNGLFDYMMTNLYLIPVEDAISVLQELLKHDSTEKAGRFLIHYLRIAHALREDFDYMEAIRFLLSNKYSITGDQRLELQRLFKDQLKLCRSSRRTSLENLMAILGMPPCSDVTKKRKRIEVLVSPVQLSIDMKEQWELTKDKSHRNAFILICDHFQKESRAFPSLAATEISGLPRALISQTLFQKLAKKLDDTRSKLNQRKKWCLMALYNQIPGWKSVLTAMVQFTDLWIEEWIHPDVSETFLSLISSENLIIQSYQHLRRLLNVLQLNVIEKRKAEDVCRFFYKLLDRIEDPAKLVALRNFIFTDMIHDHPMTFNLFGSISVVDLKIEITRALNQHVRLENGCTDSHVLRKLLMLSILYPYGVMKEIVSECIMSKDKQRTIIPLLYQMDGLCRLGITNTESGKVTTLFDEFFQNYLSEIRSDGTNINLADVRAFFRSTTQDLKEKSNDIPVLGPYERAAFSANIPINLGTFLRDQLPGLLAIPNDSTSIKLGLEILAAACHVESEQWEKLTDITTLPESILLKAQPIELCFVLTKIQNLRYSNSLDLPPQYAEMALTIQQKLSAAISLTTNYDTTVYSHILVIMKKLEKDFDWRARMLWSDLDYSICYRHDPSCAKITVPSAVKSLVHTLGGSCQIFEGREMQNEDPWAVFFDCCKLSLSFINQVFAAKEFWEEGFRQLCCDPTSDNLVIKYLFQSLYPVCSQSVISEYERLLVYFLKKIYASSNVHESIVKHPYYSPYMNSIAHNLDHEDSESLWIIIHCVALLRYPRSTMADTSAENYFIASIIKVMQSLKNWSDIASVAPEFRSLKKVQDGIYSPEISQDNLAAVYDKDGQPKEDAIESINQEDLIVDVFFPFNTRKHRSARTLSLLTFCMLCQVCETLGSITMNDSIRVYLLQITEGLKDKRRRGDFIQLAESQGKARLANWRKASGNKRRAVLRPLFTQKEKDALLIPHLDLLDDQRETICQTLNLNDRHQKVEQSHAKRLEAIYCAKQPVK